MFVEDPKTLVKGRDDISAVNWVDTNAGVLNAADEKRRACEAWVDERLLVYSCKVASIALVRLKDCDGDGARERLGFVKAMRVLVCRTNDFAIVSLSWLSVDSSIDKYDGSFAEAKLDSCW